MATFSHMVRAFKIIFKRREMKTFTKVKSILIDFNATDKVFDLLIATQFHIKSTYEITLTFDIVKSV